MKKHINPLPLITVTLYGCTMNAGNIEDACYIHQDFNEVVNCINQHVTEEYHIPRTRNSYKLYNLKAHELFEKVKEGKISKESAKMELSLYRIRLEKEDSVKVQNALDIMSGKENQENQSPVQQGVVKYSNEGNKVYSSEECIGSIIMGRCHGEVIDDGSYHKTCYGEWLNGQCTGPYF